MKKKLCTPLEKEDVKELKLGDIVYLSGEIYTARDKAHIRIIEYENAGKEIPVSNLVIYHCGPLMKKSKGRWEVIAAGPTTSSRMEETTPEIIEILGTRGIIGKGGMGISSREAMKKYGCVYFSMTGGAAVLAANSIKGVKNVYWEDLGMAEAVWHLYVEDFGPLVVSIDTNGNSLYKKIEEEATQKLEMMCGLC
jgi:fumarate hydratase subunit beta